MIIRLFAATLVLALFASSSIALETVNTLGSKMGRNPADGARIIANVRSVLRSAAYRDAVTKLVIEDVWRPYKVSFGFWLNERISEAALSDLSEAVISGVGRGLDNYFVGFHLEGETGGYWASGHNGKVKLYGLSSVDWDALVESVKLYQPARGERIIAQAAIGSC